MSLLESLAARAIPEPNSGCWLWEGSVNPKGYGNVHIGGKKGTVCLTHRLMWQITKGPIPTGMLVCHKCDVPSCINPDHLFIGTSQDNTDDMVRKGRHSHGDRSRAVAPRGEGHYLAKLSDEKVRAIRADSRVQRVIADEYGLSQTLISQVKLRKIWTHV